MYVTLVIILSNSDFKIYSGDVDKNVTSNITLQNRKFLMVRPSHLHRTIWAKYPKFGSSGFRVKIETERFTSVHVCSLYCQNIKFGDFKL